MPTIKSSLAWATDIHLDHAERDRALAFFQSLGASGCSRILLGGDTTNADRLAADMTLLGKVAGLPVSFVLGNHDYYGGSISRVRATAAELKDQGPGWLPADGCVELAPGVGLVGIGGWGDASNGNHDNSPVMLTDYFVISDLAAVYDKDRDDMSLAGQPALKELLRTLGREDAEALRPHLQAAADLYHQVVVLTHVPPFPEAAWHQGAPSHEDWLPGFSCRAMGRELMAAAERFPDTVFTVLCGHTHGEGRAELRPNLTVHTQGAEYGEPKFRLVEVSREEVVISPVDAD